MKKRRKRPKRPPGCVEGDRREPTPKVVTRAIRGSAGDRKVVAKRLGITKEAFRKILENPHQAWDRARVAFSKECEVVIEDAEDTVKDMVRQREDLKVALAAAKFVLEKRKPLLYGDRKTVVVEGGERPLKTETKTELTVDALSKVPIELRRKLMEAIEAGDGTEGAASG